MSHTDTEFATVSPGPDQGAGAGMATAALIIGIAALVFSLVPVLGLVIALAGLVLGGLAIPRRVAAGRFGTGIALSLLGGLINAVVVVVMLVGLASGPSEPAAADETTASTRPEAVAAEPEQLEEPAAVEPSPAPTLVAAYGTYPEAQRQFVEAVLAARESAGAAENDLQKGAAKATRDAAMCAAIGSGAVEGWTGRVKTIDANGEGKGIIKLEIADGVEVGTWNNFLSDAVDETLVESSSPVFTSALALSEGDVVTFGGTFIDDGDDGCVHNSRMSLDGDLEDPSFIFRFSSLG